MKIVFRTDASIQIGTGHVMRCLTLADELTRQCHECWFVCREHEGHLEDLISSKGYGLALLPAPVESDSSDNYTSWLGVPWQEDATQTLNAIEPLKPDWLVVDHYALDAEWERILTYSVGKIMVIDDLANRRHECALLLDQNLGRKPEDYDALVPEDCHRLTGPSFALLRPEFAALRERSLSRRKRIGVSRILVTMGGVDRKNVTGLVLNALAWAELPSTALIDVVMGKSAPQLKEIEEQVLNLPFHVTVNVNVSDMAERMCRADLAIGAAGSTSWERCCLGLPSLTVVLAENQRSIAQALSQAGATEILDSKLTIGQVLHDKSLLSRMSDNAAKICDGLGVSRVCERIVSINA